MRRTVPLLITFLVGLLLTVSYFVPRIEDWREDFSVWFDILAAFAFILGGGNLLKLHGERVYRQRRGWGYSAVAVVAFLATCVLLGIEEFHLIVQWVRERAWKRTRGETAG